MLQPFSLLPHVATPDLSSRPSPRARFPGSTGRGYGHLEVPGAVGIIASRGRLRVFGVSTTYVYTDGPFASLIFYWQLVGCSLASYLMLQKAAEE